MDIVGVGGCRSGADAFELLLCGACAVQVATTHWLEGPACFERIASELEALMARKGCAAETRRGRLPPHRTRPVCVLARAGVG